MYVKIEVESKQKVINVPTSFLYAVNEKLKSSTLILSNYGNLTWCDTVYERTNGNTENK